MVKLEGRSVGMYCPGIVGERCAGGADGLRSGKLKGLGVSSISSCSDTDSRSDSGSDPCSDC